MKVKRNQPGTGSAAQPKCKWPLFTQLTFLDNVSYERSTQSNIASYNVVTTLPEENVLQEDVMIEDSRNVLDDLQTSAPEQSKEEDNNSLSKTAKRKSSIPLGFVTKKKKDNNTRILEILEKRANEREKLVEKLSTSKRSDDEDPTLSFFRSMALTVKTFPPNFIAAAKSKIFEVVSEFEIRSLQIKQGSGTTDSDTISDVALNYDDDQT
ncbi:uncharacterized protein [Onthophagus taurus]|uniref:uncharacterized protein n=1 Tax=Onthophagus taurus TaxID=166361 RepID=UPI0039BE640A